MKRFSEFRVGDTFHSTCSISEKELDAYLDFSRIRNALLKYNPREKNRVVSGRAILARMEGEFTRLSQVYGNQIVFAGTDGDPGWGNRNTRFLSMLHTDQILRIKFTVSHKEDADEHYGRIFIDYEGETQDGQTVLVSKRNIYRIKKEP